MNTIRMNLTSARFWLGLAVLALVVMCIRNGEITRMTSTPVGSMNWEQLLCIVVAARILWTIRPYHFRPFGLTNVLNSLGLVTKSRHQAHVIGLMDELVQKASESARFENRMDNAYDLLRTIDGMVTETLKPQEIPDGIATPEPDHFKNAVKTMAATMNACTAMGYAKEGHEEGCQD